MDFSTTFALAAATLALAAAIVATVACCMRDAKYNALPAAEPSQIDTPPRQIDAVLNQARANQDYFVVYRDLVDEKGKRFDVICVFDGHGDDECINAIRSMDLRQFFVLPNPCEALYEACRGFKGGATINLFRIYKDCIENHNIGDSQGKVFKMVDGTWVIQATSVMHSPDNPDERERLGVHAEYYDRSKGYNNITGPSEISSIAPGVSVTFLDAPPRDPLQLMVTQALGHKGLTGCHPEFFSVPIVPGQRYRVICATDGPWDVLGDFDHNALCTLSAQGIIDLVRVRYAQEWNVTHSGVFAGLPNRKFTYPPSLWDDCAVCICDI